MDNGESVQSTTDGDGDGSAITQYRARCNDRAGEWRNEKSRAREDTDIMEGAPVPHPETGGAVDMGVDGCKNAWVEERTIHPGGVNAE